jgi:hypothetical protein
MRPVNKVAIVGVLVLLLPAPKPDVTNLAEPICKAIGKRFFSLIVNPNGALK